MPAKIREADAKEDFFTNKDTKDTKKKIINEEPLGELNDRMRVIPVMRIIHLALLFALTRAVFADQTEPPIIIRSVLPAYPAEALKSRLEGKVILELEISRKGRVMNARVMRTDNIIFNQPSLAAVKLWRYRITKENLKSYCRMSVDCSVMYKSVTVVFILPDSHPSSPHP